MRIRAVVALALAAGAVAGLTAMPAFAASGGTKHPWKSSGTQTGSFKYRKGPPVVFNFDIVGPFVASPSGRGTVRTFTPVTGKNGQRVVYTFTNGDKLYAYTGQTLSAKGVVCAAGTALASARIVAGGTRRFRHARGTFVVHECLSFPNATTFTAKFTENGTLIY